MKIHFNKDLLNSKVYKVALFLMGEKNVCERYIVCICIEKKKNHSKDLLNNVFLLSYISTITFFI